MESVISVKDLYKNYSKNEVLKGINFNVVENEIFALLGMNGAGKTTTLECIENLLNYHLGEIIINGKCGVQLQNSSLPKNMKIKEAIIYFSKWNHLPYDDSFVELLGDKRVLNMQYGECSTGQKRRVHLLLALLGNPDILILDEPTSGLDVEGRMQIHNEIKRLKQIGKTIILATHDMNEVESLCDRVAILKEGRIVFCDSIEHLIENQSNNLQLKISFSNDPVFNIKYKKEAQIYIFETNNINSTLTSILHEINDQDISIKNIVSNQDTIQQRFIDIAGV